MLVMFGVIAAVAGGGYWYWQKSAASDAGKGATPVKSEGKKGKGKGGGPIAVRMTAAKRQAMPVVIDAVGSVESEHSVAVRPQVNGIIQARLFETVPFIPLGQYLPPAGYRNNLTGVLKGALPVFWNVSKA